MVTRSTGRRVGLVTKHVFLGGDAYSKKTNPVFSHCFATKQKQLEAPESAHKNLTLKIKILEMPARSKKLKLLFRDQRMEKNKTFSNCPKKS